MDSPGCGTCASLANWIAVGGMTLCCVAAYADSEVEKAPSGVHSSSHGSTRVQNRLAAGFGTFAGSNANASRLVAGLRNGTPVVLRTSGAPGQPPTKVAFDPPTRPMGYGNVFISLALARQQLLNAGITRPTPDQIQTALMGGSITTGSGGTAQTTRFPGVLTQRSHGLGWGQIAQSQGMSLGKVVSGIKAGSHEVSAQAAHRGAIANAERRGEMPQGNDHIGHRSGSAAVGAQALSTQARGRGIVTALGTSADPVGAKNAGPGGHQHGWAAIAAAGNVRSAGIVNAHGAAAAASGPASSSAGAGHAHGGR